MPESPPATPITVLQCALRPPKGASGYIDQITTHAPADIRFRYLSVGAMLFGDFDVVHLHWPDFLVRGVTPVLSPVHMLVASAFVARLRLSGTPVVSTMHNLAPHEGVSRVGSLLLRQLEKGVRAYIRLNEFTPEPDGTACVVIPHGHYGEVVGAAGEADPVRGRVVYCGLVRRYKGVDTLLRAFAGLDDAGVSLRVVGFPYDLGVAQEVVRATRRDSRVTADLRYVPDEVMARELAAAELVVLPYRQMHNSGTVLFALSLRRPVLVPDTPVNRALRDEVGLEWVHLFPGELDTGALRAALERTARGLPASPPRFAGRDWRAIAQRHADVYRAVAEPA